MSNPAPLSYTVLQATTRHDSFLGTSQPSVRLQHLAMASTLNNEASHTFSAESTPTQSEYKSAFELGAFFRAYF